MESLWLRKESNTRAVILFHAYTGTPADVENACAVFYIVMIMQSMFQYFLAMELQMWKISWQVLLSWYEDAKSAVDFVRGEGFHTVTASDYRWAVLWRQN